VAFDKAPLKTGIEASLETRGTAAQGAQAWADAYGTYAAGGMSCQAVSAQPAAITAAKAALVSALTSSFGSGSASGAAGGMSSAFEAFWLAMVPGSFVGATPGGVTGVGGTSALSSALSSAFNQNKDESSSTSVAAQRFADALDIFSKTVIVTHAAPSACAAALT
jgi:hypothetical protein